MTGETESQRQAQSSLVGRDAHSGTQRNKKTWGVSQLSHGDGEEREGSLLRRRWWHYESPETSIRPTRKLWAPLQKGVFLCVYYMDVYYRKPWSFTLNNFTVPNRLLPPVTWKMPEVLIQVLLTFGRRIWSERSEWEVVVESRPRGVWACGTVRWLHPLPSHLDFKLCPVDPVSRVFWHSPLQGRSHSLGPFTFGCLGKHPPLHLTRFLQ